MKAAAGVVLLAVLAAQGQAQLRLPTGTSAVVGRMVDRDTGVPIIRLHACVVFNVGPPYGQASRCVMGDTLGWYRLDSLPAGRHTISYWCNNERPFNGGARDSALVVLDSADTATIDGALDGGRCDQRPLVIRRSVFRGYYSYGFEESVFHDVPDAPRTWVDFTPAVLRARTPKWPAFPDSAQRVCAYVEWEGTLSGPGIYGHMGFGSHELLVDRIRVIRRAPLTKCRD